MVYKNTRLAETGLAILKKIYLTKYVFTVTILQLGIKVELYSAGVKERGCNS